MAVRVEMNSGFKNICVRSGLLVVVFAAFGLAFNAVSPKGVSIFKEPPKPTSPWKHLSLEEGFALWQEQEAIFVDAREVENFQAGHISRAMNLPEYEFEKHWAEFAQNVAPELDLVIYCNGGDCEQSHKLAERLKQAGYTRIAILADGYLGWRDGKFPTTPKK
jgi:rhodanese-related sulfurtransferase